MELLRFSTAGSVDDGKSTLIGRLLHDSGGAYEDQIAAVKKASRNGMDFSLLTDGLRAEREQGITIDVAYRYFSTPRRKFIIADTPGHEQYTRNMATGASTADLAVVLVDARHGVLQQSRRHAYIAWLLGIPRIVVAVNKMDLVDYRREIFDSVRAEFDSFSAQLGAVKPYYIPLSALCGDNVVNPSAHMPWYDGKSLLRYLEEAPVADGASAGPLRFPVQYVIRPDQDFRGYAGQVASGVARPGEEVLILPSGRTSRVKSVVTWDGNLQAAAPPMSVTVCLEDEIDISRGDMLVSAVEPPHAARRLEATVVWMAAKPLAPGRGYILKHTTRQVRATVRAIRHRVDMDNLAHHPAGELRLNDIGAVTIETHHALFFDPYLQNRATGSFILIDPLTSETAGAGMIAGPCADDCHTGPVTGDERVARYGHPGLAIWLDGSLQTARTLERKLFDLGCAVCVFDGEAETVTSAASAARDAGLIAVCVATDNIPPDLSPGRLVHLKDHEALHIDLEKLLEANSRSFIGGDGI
ncbi:MAG TPA: sulfate adenylyltransferase subunit CysN [Bryobacteraceae bacterium]|nr:sulfate adenylyltransferase subunit CysN [Bryobacteraceae bacterium]